RDPWIGLYLRRPPTEWHRARQAELEDRVLKGADRVLAASRTHADALEGRARRVTHLPHGFAPEVAPPSPPSESQFLLVFTGTLSQMPETETLLEALHDLLARRPALRRKLRARLAGPYEQGYEDRSIALGLKGIVDFPGPLSHTEARALQRSADLLLLWKPPA